MAADLDVRFQTALAERLPGVLVNPTGSLERSDAVEDRLADLRGDAALRLAAGATPRRRRRADVPRSRCSATRRTSPATSAGSTRRRPAADAAPACAAASCSSTSGPTPASTASARCPYLQAWDARYRDDGPDDRRRPHARVRLRDATPATSRDAIAQNGLRYPVAQDNEFATWNAWGNQYWPAKYLIDAHGPGPLRPLRRGRVRRDRGRDPQRCSRRPATSGSARRAEPARRDAVGRARDARDLSRQRARRAASARRSDRRHARPIRAPARAAAEPLRARRPLARRRRVRRGGARRDARARNVVGTAVYLVLGSRGDRPRRRPGRARRQADPAADAGRGRRDGARDRPPPAPLLARRAAAAAASTC